MLIFSLRPEPFAFSHFETSNGWLLEMITLGRFNYDLINKRTLLRLFLGLAFIKFDKTEDIFCHKATYWPRTVNGNLYCIVRADEEAC